MSYILTHTTLTATRLFWLTYMWPEWFPHLTSPCIFFQYFSSSSSREYCQCYKSIFWLSLILVKFYFVSFFWELQPKGNSVLSYWNYHSWESSIYLVICLLVISLKMEVVFGSYSLCRFGLSPRQTGESANCKLPNLYQLLSYCF